MPRPVTMNAAFGGPGRDFAAAHCDYPVHHLLRDSRGGKARRRHPRARAEGRPRCRLYTVCHVVCRETEEEAEDYYTRYAVTMADHAAVDAHMAGKKEFSQSHDADAYDRYRQRFAGGAGTYPLIGTPEKIVEDMIAHCRAGLCRASR